MAEATLLVGDIGGTNARFALAEPGGELRDVEVMPVAAYETFEDALAHYLSTADCQPAALCIASAGMMKNDFIAMTNAPWAFGADALRERFGFKLVSLVNDFQAQARFGGELPEGSFEELKGGTPVAGTPVLTVGPGTGFGQALSVPGKPPKIIATEGGHRLMLVRNGAELRLCERLQERLGHFPIIEETLSGRGLLNLYEATVLEEGGTPDVVEPPAITAAALAGDGAARRAVLWFFDILACAAADAAFSTGARGGIAISGGIVPRFHSLLPEIPFAESFTREGPLTPYLADLPVWLVTDPFAALKGAACLMRDKGF
ncbi:MAG: ROK family protein [Parvularcula sp.]|jgi:glucokinase|nr:ROK family protein [Parvularcula sp.]